MTDDQQTPPFTILVAVQALGRIENTNVSREHMLYGVVTQAMDAIDELFWVWDHPDDYPDHDGLVTKGLSYGR